MSTTKLAASTIGNFPGGQDVKKTNWFNTKANENQSKPCKNDMKQDIEAGKVPQGKLQGHPM